MKNKYINDDYDLELELDPGETLEAHLLDYYPPDRYVKPTLTKQQIKHRERESLRLITDARFSVVEGWVERNKVWLPVLAAVGLIVFGIHEGYISYFTH